MNKELQILTFLVVVGVAPAASAQQPGANLGVDLDSQTLNVQAKAEELFQSEDYRRAHGIYLNDLAPIGDKYAQYMLGFMRQTGLGVEQDRIMASAWYRLAAERGEPEQFVEIRDELLDQLDDADRARSDQAYLELRRRYSDVAISMREARRLFEKLPHLMTGSRLGSPTSPVTIVEPRAGNSPSSDTVIRRTQRRMQGYLDHVTATLGIERIPSESITAGALSGLEEQVRDYVSRPETR